MSQGHAPGGQNQFGVNVFAHGPAGEAAAVKVQNAGQIEPAFLGGDIGDVPKPDLVGRAGGGQIGQAIGGDGLVVIAVGGADAEAAFGASTEALQAHETGNAMAAISVAGPAQRFLNAGAAVGLAALLMNLDDLLGQAPIFQGARAGLGLAVLNQS